MLTDFIQHIKKYNIARPNRYQVNFGIPTKIRQNMVDFANSMSSDFTKINSSRNVNEIPTDVEKVLSLTCLMAGIPGYQEQTTSSTNGNQARKIVNGKSNGEFTTTFLVSGNYLEKKAFDVWHNLIMKESNNSFAFYDDYISQLEVICFDNQDQPVYTFYLTEAYPISVSALRLDRTAQNQQMVIDVTWAYHKFATLRPFDPTSKNEYTPPREATGIAAATGKNRLLPIPGLDSFSAGVKGAMDTVKGFRDQVKGALAVVSDVREQIRDAKMQVLDGIKVINGVVKDVREIANVPTAIKNEVVAVINDTKNQLGSLKADTKLIVSPFPKR